MAVGDGGVDAHDTLYTCSRHVGRGAIEYTRLVSRPSLISIFCVVRFVV